MALQKSEKRLMSILGVALFIVANVIGLSVLEKKKGEVKTLQDSYNKKLGTYEFLNEGKEIWEQRRNWLMSNTQPSFVSEETAADEIESHLNKCAVIAGMPQTSLVVKPTEMREQPFYTQVALNVATSGSSRSITQLISLLQSANHSTKDGFYAITNIKFEADRKDPSILKCAFILARWYTRSGSLSGFHDPSVGDLVNHIVDNKLWVSK